MMRGRSRFLFVVFKFLIMALVAGALVYVMDMHSYAEGIGTGTSVEESMDLKKTEDENSGAVAESISGKTDQIRETIEAVAAPKTSEDKLPNIAKVLIPLALLGGLAAVLFGRRMCGFAAPKHAEETFLRLSDELHDVYLLCVQEVLKADKLRLKQENNGTYRSKDYAAVDSLKSNVMATNDIMLEFRMRWETMHKRKTSKRMRQSQAGHLCNQVKHVKRDLESTLNKLRSENRKLGHA